MESVAAHEDNDRSLVRFATTSCINNLERGKFMVIDTSNINACVEVGMDNASVIANDASICSPIDQGTASRTRYGVGHTIFHMSVNFVRGRISLDRRYHRLGLIGYPVYYVGSSQRVVGFPKSAS